jgi:hypothetical protein
MANIAEFCVNLQFCVVTVENNLIINWDFVSEKYDRKLNIEVSSV